MGLMSFIKEAGEKLFHRGDAKAAQEAAAAEPSPENKAAANQAAADAIASYIGTQGIDTSSLTVAFDGDNAAVTVDGAVTDQATKEKILLCCGNVAGVAAVGDVDELPADGLGLLAQPCIGLVEHGAEPLGVGGAQLNPAAAV